jgi:hypothetical protein
MRETTTFGLDEAASVKRGWLKLLAHKLAFPPVVAGESF